MYLGIDIGGTNLKAGLLNQSNEILNTSSIASKSNIDSDTFFNQILNYISYFIENFDIDSIGIGVPGTVDADGTIAIAPNLKGWINFEFGKKLKEYIDLPIAIDNDANAAAYAELVLGSGQDLNNFIYATLGTGFGGAIIINKDLFRGSSGAAGEFGHVIIDADSNILSDNDLPSFRLGVVEEFISRNSILKEMQKLTQIESSLLYNEHDYDVADLSFAADNNDIHAINLLKKLGYYLGVSLSSIINILDITKVVFGGGVSASHHSFFDSAFETIKHRALPHVANSLEFRKAKFNKDAGIIGAALLGKKLISQ